jgi:DNA-binding MarR family transcriptional regulator
MKTHPNTQRIAASKTLAQAPAQIDRTVYIPHFLNTLNNKLSSGASDLYIKLFGIGINDWRVLSVAVKNPGCIANFIAEKMDVHKAIVSRSVQFLRDQGYLRIVPEGKQRLIHVNADGQALYSDIARVALERERLLLQGLTDEQQATLRSLLAHLLANVAAVNAYSP